MGLRKKLGVLLIIVVLMEFYGMFKIAPSAEADLIEQSPYPVVYVYPNFTDTSVGETFTIAVIGFNFTDTRIQDPHNPTIDWPAGNLYGFDIQFTWDPTILKYVNHTVTVHVDEYPAPNPPSPYEGVLYKPTIEIMHIVDEGGNIPLADYPETRAWFAYASMLPAEPQNGNVTFFTMTFNVTKAGESPLRILACSLSDVNGEVIYKDVYDGLYRTAGVPQADFTYQPTTPVVNRTVEFTATVTGNTSNIATYIWDFGDGSKENTTVPTISHNYTSAGDKTVSLKVVDEGNVESGLVQKTLRVIAFRDLRVSEVKLPAVPKIKIAPENLLNFTAKIENLGEIVENCTVSAYYNITVVDSTNPEAATWKLIEEKNITLEGATVVGPGVKLLTFSLNATLLTVNASYYTFVKITRGIPTVYERDITDNYRLSDTTIFATDADIHEISIVKFDCVWVSTGGILENPPLIQGEDGTIRLTIKNLGTGPDTVNVTLYLDGASIENRSISIVWGEEKTVSWKETITAGNYSLTMVVETTGFSTNTTIPLRVIRPPQLQITIEPSAPVANQTVTLDASASIHLDPEGNITLFTWRIFAPGVQPVEGVELAILNGKIVNYNFTQAGNWTIRLDVIDNFGLKYAERRPATYVYRKETIVEVSGPVQPPPQEGLGIPIEYIIATVLVIVLIAAGIFVLYRRRGARKIEEPKTEET